MHLCRLVAGVLFAATAAVAVLTAACEKTVSTLSPDNLGVEAKSDLPVYAPRDTFSGTLTFTNKTSQRIKAEFPTASLYHVDFYDVDGNLRRAYFPVRDSVVTYLEMGPLGARVEPLKFLLYSPPESILAGAYRVHAWVDGHPDIYSEIAIEVR